MTDDATAPAEPPRVEIRLDPVASEYRARLAIAEARAAAAEERALGLAAKVRDLQIALAQLGKGQAVEAPEKKARKA
ncbi:MAG: hypothetical protein K5872_08835 [Rhizobiaceae bacterium]|nr:hypothetical protein [Rhizobiaceae bacterium]MCV0406320.1 hypothetical protein [Rhizobiaceae bacterium]